MAVAHPVLYRRIEAARAANPSLKIIVVDPRRTDTAAGNTRPNTQRHNAG
jgi:assimilatory nitrate reductase catalytic subunit